MMLIISLRSCELTTERIIECNGSKEFLQITYSTTSQEQLLLSPMM